MRGPRDILLDGLSELSLLHPSDAVIVLDAIEEIMKLRAERDALLLKLLRIGGRGAEGAGVLTQ